MILTVLKTGATRFDALLALGLAVVMSAAYDVPVDIQDCGSHYSLTYEKPNEKREMILEIEDLLPIPNLDEVKDYLITKVKQPSLKIVVLNGLLSAFLTSPGVKTPSVDDFRFHRDLPDKRILDCITKVRAQRERIEKIVRKKAYRLSTWISKLEDDYRIGQPIEPELVTRRNHSRMIVPMPIEASFGFSNRNPLSDNKFDNSTNISINGRYFNYSSILSIIGASRYLQSFKVNKDYYVISILIPSNVTIHYNRFIEYSGISNEGVESGIAYQFISHSLKFLHQKSGHWLSYSYQVFQGQKNHSPILFDIGILDFLMSPSKPMKYVFSHWLKLYRYFEINILAEQINLLNKVILNNDPDMWIQHLSSIAILSSKSGFKQFLQYSHSMAREVTKNMNNNLSTKTSPMSNIMSRKTGTQRFGHALRQIREFNLVKYHDIVDGLDSAKNNEEVIRIAGNIVLENRIRNPMAKYAIIPKDSDFKLFLDDLELYGFRTISSILVALSGLKFNSRKIQEDDKNKDQF